MKNLAVYSFTGKTSFNEEYVLNNTIRELTSEEDTLSTFTPLFDDTYIQGVERFSVAKVVFQERKEPDNDFLEQEALKELPEEHTEEELADKVYQLRRKFIQFTGMKKPQESLVVIDNQTGKLIIGNNPNNADKIMHTVLSSLEGGYEYLHLVTFEAPLIEKLLTNYILNESKHLPDPFMLVEKVALGDKSEFEKSPKAVTVSVKKAYPADEEILAFISNCHKVVKLLQLEYDGVVEFDFTNKFEFKGIKFKEGLAYEDDPELAPSVNFMSQYVLQLPTVFDIVNKLEEQVNSVEI